MDLILAAADERVRELFAQAAAEQQLSCRFAASGSQARQALRLAPAGILAIYAPLPDEFGADLAAEAAERLGWAVIFLVQAQHWQKAASRLSPYGVLTVASPAAPQLLRQTLCLAAASQRRLAALQRENRRLQDKIDEIRLVARAKQTLMQVLGLSEAQAHRAIEKQAMDLRLTRRAVAEQVLRNYEE